MAHDEPEQLLSGGVSRKLSGLALSTESLEDAINLRIDTPPVRENQGESTAYENEHSRELKADVQRLAERESFYVRRLPDDALVDPALIRIAPGQYHPWHLKSAHPGYDWMTATNFQMTHHIGGEDGKAYTRVDVSWEKTPSSNTYQVRTSAASVGHSEWFTREKVVESGPTADRHYTLTQGKQPLTQMFPQLVAQFRWPRLKLSLQTIDKWESLQGYVDYPGVDEQGNEEEHVPIKRKGKHFWRLHAFDADQLYGNPESDECWYQVTATLIGDPWRGHMFWFPRLAQGGDLEGGFVFQDPTPDSHYPKLDTDINTMMKPWTQQPAFWLYNVFSHLPRAPLAGLLRLGDDPAGQDGGGRG